jgi:hypothetical protein
MMNEVVMDQVISFHNPNKKCEEWEDDRLAYYSNQTIYKDLIGLLFHSLEFVTPNVS